MTYGGIRYATQPIDPISLSCSFPCLRNVAFFFPSPKRLAQLEASARNLSQAKLAREASDRGGMRLTKDNSRPHCMTRNTRLTSHETQVSEEYPVLKKKKKHKPKKKETASL